jgi:CspA family cold shock protein
VPRTGAYNNKNDRDEIIMATTGKVKWFNNAKGYGFVRADVGGDDLFVHYSYIQTDGYKSLKAGQPVEFEIQQGDKGDHAINLRPTEEVENSSAL